MATLGRRKKGLGSKKGFIRSSIERLESLEDATLRNEGLPGFQVGESVLITQGPHKGRVGRVKGSVRQRFGTKKKLLVQVGVISAKGQTEIMVVPGNALQHNRTKAKDVLP